MLCCLAFMLYFHVLAELSLDISLSAFPQVLFKPMLSTYNAFIVVHITQQHSLFTCTIFMRHCRQRTWHDTPQQSSDSRPRPPGQVQVKGQGHAACGGLNDQRQGQAGVIWPWFGLAKSVEDSCLMGSWEHRIFPSRSAQSLQSQASGDRLSRRSDVRRQRWRHRCQAWRHLWDHTRRGRHWPSVAESSANQESHNRIRYASRTQAQAVSLGPEFGRQKERNNIWTVLGDG